MTKKRHILIVKHGALGDVVRTSYFADALRKEHGAQARLSWVTSTASPPLLRFHPAIDDLCSAITGSLSVSSLRADSLSGTLVERLAKSGHKTIALAPEAGSERLRKVINKGVAEADILRAADLVFGAGIPNLKLYFIIGLPTETQEDIDAIITLAEQVRGVQLRHARRVGRIGRITLSVNSFVPKPFTPFQWEPMEAVASLNRKQRSLDKAVKRIGNMNCIHDLPKWEYVQALLSRGDRRIVKLLCAAHEAGGDWKAAARKLGADMDFTVARRRAFDEVLPWDFMTAISKSSKPTATGGGSARSLRWWKERPIAPTT